MSKGETVMLLITSALTLIKGTAAGQLRKNIRLALKLEKKLIKRIKKEGITE